MQQEEQENGDELAIYKNLEIERAPKQSIDRFDSVPVRSERIGLKKAEIRCNHCTEQQHLSQSTLLCGY